MIRFDENELFYREKDRELKRIPFSHHVSDEMIASKDGSLFVFFSMEGLASEFLTEDERQRKLEEKAIIYQALNDERLTIYSYYDNAKAELKTQNTKNKISTQIRNEFAKGLNQKGLLKSKQFLVLEYRVYRDGERSANSVLSFFGVRNAIGDYKAKRLDAIETLNNLADRVMSAFSEYGIKQLKCYRKDGVKYSQPLSLLVRLVNGNWQPVSVPKMDLSAYLSSSRKRFSHGVGEVRSPSIQYFQAISIKDYPESTNLSLLDDLFRIDGKILVSQSFRFIESHDIKDKIEKQINRLIESADVADSQVDDLKESLDDLVSGRICFGDHHFTVMVYSDSIEKLKKISERVNTALTRRGIIPVIEDTGLEAAYWSLLPGNNKYSPRLRPITNYNFSCATSFSGENLGYVGTGWGTPVAQFPTNSKKIFNFNWHEKNTADGKANADASGHTIIVGPNGSGKTTIAGYCLQQSLGLGAKVVILDKDSSNELLVRANCGIYSAVSPEKKTLWSPFSMPDSKENRAFLISWLQILLGTDDLNDQQKIESIVSQIYSREGSKRLSYVAPLFGSPSDPNSLAFKLQRFINEGQYNFLFDNDGEAFGFESEIVGFDLTHLLDIKDASVREAVGFYLLYGISQLSKKGEPLVVYWEELWKFLDVQGVFQESIKDMLKTIRKKNGVVVGSTQDVADAAETKIASVLRNEFVTKVLFPNATAVFRDYQSVMSSTPEVVDRIRSFSKSDRKCIVLQGHEKAIVDVSFPTNALKYIPLFSTSNARLQQLKSLGIPDKEIFEAIEQGDIF